MKEKISRVRVAIVTVMLMVSFGIVLSGGNTDIAKATSKKPKLNKTKIELTKGDTFKLKLSNAKNVKWSSNKKTVATVDKKGKVTAKKKGNAVISAKYLKRIYKCKVKVVEPKKIETNEISETKDNISEQNIKTNNTNIAIALSQTSAIISVADQIALSVSVEPSSVANRVIWSTSDEKVATVQNGIVTGVSAGTCIITSSIDNIVANCTIQVNQAYGSVSGNITYYYNDFKGSVPDTGSVVILIPEDGTAKSMPTFKFFTEWLMESSIKDCNKYKVFSTSVDGTGSYSISNIPIGKYIIFVKSRKTTSEVWAANPDAYPGRIALFLYGYINDENADKLGEAVGYNKYTRNTITITKDKDTKFSHDFGITYF